MSNKINTNFGRLIKGQIDYAPTVLKIDGSIIINPSKEIYLENGYKSIVDKIPETKDGGYWSPSGWDEDETTITRLYTWNEYQK